LTTIKGVVLQEANVISIKIICSTFTTSLAIKSL
jgi:hypothetical protein